LYNTPSTNWSSELDHPVPILLGEAKINEVQNVRLFAAANQEVVGLDIPMDEVFGMQILDPELTHKGTSNANSVAFQHFGQSPKLLKQHMHPINAKRSYPSFFWLVRFQYSNENGKSRSCAEATSDHPKSTQLIWNTTHGDNLHKLGYNYGIPWLYTVVCMYVCMYVCIHRNITIQ